MSGRGLIWLLLVSMGTAQAAELSLEQRLERLERRVDKVTELTLQVDALRRENRELRGRIEVQEHTIQGLERKQRDLYLDIDQRIGQLQGAAGTPPTTPGGQAAVPAPPVGQAPGVAASGGGATAANPAREAAEYQAAYDLLRPEQRRYPEAIEAFRAFLAKYPNSKFADNAQYWLAEASYVTQDNATALVEFQKLVAQFPDSPKVPGALLKIGYIEHAAGQIDAARETLGRVAKDYANTPEADMAQQRLQRIAREAR